MGRHIDTLVHSGGSEEAPPACQGRVLQRRRSAPVPSLLAVRSTRSFGSARAHVHAVAALVITLRIFRFSAPREAMSEGWQEIAPHVA